MSCSVNINACFENNYVYYCVWWLAWVGVRRRKNTRTCRSLGAGRPARDSYIFTKHLLKENRNELTRNIFIKKCENGDTKWIKTLKVYMKKIDMNITQINSLSKYSIIDKIKKWATTNWKNEIQTKTTLHIYNLHKKDLREESWVDNTLGSKLILRGRTNTNIKLEKQISGKKWTMSMLWLWSWNIRTFPVRLWRI